MPQEGTFALTAVVEQESIEDQWEQHFRQGSSRCKGSAVGGAWGREGLRQAGLGWGGDLGQALIVDNLALSKLKMDHF